MSLTNRIYTDYSDPLGLIARARTKFHTLWLSLSYPFASLGVQVSIHHSVDLQRPMARRIRLGNRVVIGKDAWLNVLDHEKDQPAVIVDDDCVVARRCQISAKNCIHLEYGVILSASAILMDHNHAFEDVSLAIREQGATDGGVIRIERGCWIGHGAAIVCDSGELVIGRNSVVAANALVTRSFPAYSVIAGNPARVVKQFDPVKNAWVLGSVRSTYQTENKEHSAAAIS